MTNQQNFKKGDRVRVKSTDIEDIVIDVCNGNVFLKDNGYWSANVLELVESLDRRTDFLRKLGALLREFDARIGYFIGDDEKYGWSDYPFLKVGKETIKYPAGEIDEINADNIMEFEKE